MWNIYQQMRIQDQDARLSDHKHAIRDTSVEVAELSLLVRKMALVNQALFELLKERTGISDEDLRRKIKEVDLRDGVEDHKVKQAALKCPKCGSVVTVGSLKCPTCGATIAPKYPYEA